MENFKDLCRLCTNHDEFSKDLLDESSSNTLKLVEEYSQIMVNRSDSLPTKICMKCEEKFLSFQLFILNCHKAQDTLEKLYISGNQSILVKNESEIVVNPSEIKSEVKDEMTAEDIVNVLNNDSSLSNTYMLYDNDHHFDNGEPNEEEDFSDDVTIAALKEIKKKAKKKIKTTKKQVVHTEEVNKIFTNPNIKAKDVIKYLCNICGKDLRNWTRLSKHSTKCHDSDPVVFCVCGFKIRSKAKLYKHVYEHKSEISPQPRQNHANGEVAEDDSPIKIKDYVKLICNVCQLECSSWYTLQAHCQQKHDVLPEVQCSCGITLKSKTVMYKHVQDHKNPNVYACDKCPKVTTSITALAKHKMRHIPKEERKFNCAHCEKSFNSRDALKSHVRSHIPLQDRKIYTCEICNQKFTTSSSMLSHKRVIHDKIKGFMCDLCGYSCGTNGELRQHRAIHSDDKPYVCNKCPKRFKTYSNLKTHMDTHEDTAYECYICRRILNSRRTLRKHLLVHEDKCRHVCSYCNKGFKRRQTLKVHMSTHTGDKPLSCKWCDERFAYASTLRSHRLRNHPEKMAAQAQDYTHGYVSLVTIDGQDYMKATVGVNASEAKTEEELII